MGPSGNYRFQFLPALTLKALSCLLLGAFSTFPAMAQVPIEPGAPAGDISQLPREVTRTMDSVNLSSGPNDPRTLKKKFQAEGTCFLPPLASNAPAPTVAADQLKIPGKASKEYAEACAALRGRKPEEAEKHLRAAVREYAKYAVAWVTLGQVLVRLNRADDAKLACSQALAAEPSFAPADLCLADLAARVHDWPEVLKLSEHALGLGSVYAVAGYEYNAAAYLNLHNLPAAEKSGVRAAELDRDHREPRLYFVLAQIYEAEGNREKEAEQLREYIRYAGDTADLDIVKKALLQLESRLAASQAASTQLASNSSQTTEIPSRSWAPADIDEEVPPARTDVACPLAHVLKETGRRTQDLIESLQRFSADERIEQIDFDKTGKPRSSSTQTGNYVAQVENSSGFPHIREYRAGSAGSERAAVLDAGTAAFALIFHPSHVGSFDIRCEGLTRVHDVPAWQLRFEEPADSKQAFQAIRVGGTTYLPRLKGRAWIASDDYEVLRMETDLASPIQQIGFNREHLVIDYAHVDFKSHGVRLWVPESATLYIAYRGHRYERVHRFDHFHLFSVDSQDAVKAPPVPPPSVPSQLVSLQSKLLADAGTH